jgi:hypothetical protein
MKQDQEPNNSDQEYVLPGWFIGIMRLSEDMSAFESIEVEQAEVPIDFHLRCNEATEAALSIAKLRKERQRIGFMPLPLTDYIHGLIKVANVSLSQVLAWLGTTDISFSTPEHAKALGRLAQQIGLSLRETLVSIRIGFAAQRDAVPISLLVAHRRSAGQHRSQLEECEDVLKQIEAEYASNDIRELRDTELEISQAYEAHSSPI